MREWADRHGIGAHFVHSGGHAWPEDLARLQKAIAARESHWVHTDMCAQPGTRSAPSA